MGTKSLADLLLAEYGVLMSTRDFADLIGSTEARVSNGFANGLPWTKPFHVCRLKIGRRVHFTTATVAEVLETIQRQNSDQSTTPVRQVCVERDPRAGRSLQVLIYKFCGKYFWKQEDSYAVPVMLSADDCSGISELLRSPDRPRRFPYRSSPSGFAVCQ